MKVIIVDDEIKARQVLKKVLAMHFGNRIEIVGEANGVESAIALISNTKFDLLFLDIKMPDGSGFDVLSQVDSEIFETIFTTAHDEYAIKAFQFAAVGYLLKPIDIEQLLKVTNKVMESRNTKQNHIKVLIENLRPNGHKKLVIPNNEGFHIADIDEILYLEGDINYTKFHFIDETRMQVSSKTLKDFQFFLEGEGFFRIHKSFLINLKHIKDYKRLIGSVVMNTGKELPLSRHRKQDFQTLFK
ncbi:MAG: response regulator transcription factor [Bacteroidia bacterium]|nr:response regulator transcription factor [Bacteroidia bacterium]